MPDAATPAPASPPASAPTGFGGGLREKLLKSAAQFSVAVVASQASGLLRAWFVAHALGPAAAGVWIGIQLVVTFAANAHLGAIFGLHRHVPLLRGKGDLEGAEAVRRTTLAFTSVMGLLCFFAVVLAAFGLLAPLETGTLRLPFFPNPIGLPPSWQVALANLRDPAERQLVIAVAAVLPANLLRSYYVTLFKADNRFRESTIASVWGSAVGIAAIPLIPRYGLAGVVWGMFALIVAELLYLMVKAGAPRLSFSWPVLRVQLVVGFVTVLITVANTWLMSVDRWTLFELFPAETRGYYYPALLAATFFYGLAAVPNAILYPRLSEQFGRTGEPGHLAALVDGPLRLVSVGFAYVAGAAAIALPVAVRLALPKFMPGVAASQIAMYGVACYVVVGVAINCFYALNRQLLFLAILVGSVGATYGLARLLAHFWLGLPAVAAGCSLGMLLFLVAVIVLAWIAMDRPAIEGLRTALLSIAPLLASGVATLAILAATDRLFAPASLAAAAVGLLVFTALSSPLLLRVARALRR